MQEHSGGSARSFSRSKKDASGAAFSSTSKLKIGSVCRALPAAYLSPTDKRASVTERCLEYHAVYLFMMLRFSLSAVIHACISRAGLCTPMRRYAPDPAHTNAAEGCPH